MVHCLGHLHLAHLSGGSFVGPQEGSNLSAPLRLKLRIPLQQEQALASSFLTKNPKDLKFPNAVVLNAVGSRKLKHTKERKRKSAKGRKKLELPPVLLGIP